jgi:hypothetical protein
MKERATLHSTYNEFMPGNDNSKDKNKKYFTTILLMSKVTVAT